MRFEAYAMRFSGLGKCSNYICGAVCGFARNRTTNTPSYVIDLTTTLVKATHENAWLLPKELINGISKCLWKREARRFPSAPQGGPRRKPRYEK